MTKRARNFLLVLMGSIAIWALIVYGVTDLTRAPPLDPETTSSIE